MWICMCSWYGRYGSWSDTDISGVIREHDLVAKASCREGVRGASYSLDIQINLQWPWPCRWDDQINRPWPCSSNQDLSNHNLRVKNSQIQVKWAVTVTPIITRATLSIHSSFDKTIVYAFAEHSTICIRVCMRLWPISYIYICIYIYLHTHTNTYIT